MNPETKTSSHIHILILSLIISLGSQSASSAANEATQEVSQPFEHRQAETICPEKPEGRCKDLMRKMRNYALNGSPKAQLYMAVAYLNGDGIKKSQEQSLVWLRRAVKSRNPTAVRMMSEWYRYGFIQEVDLKKADYYLEIAAKAGDAKAMVHWGIVLYDKGDTESATEFFHKAKQQGNADAKQILTYLNASVEERVAIAKATARDEAIKDEENIVTVVSDYKPIDFLVYFIANMEPAYRTAGSTGSRLRHVKCGGSYTPCITLKARDFRTVHGIKSN